MTTRQEYAEGGYVYFQAVVAASDVLAWGGRGRRPAAARSHGAACGHGAGGALPRSRGRVSAPFIFPNGAILEQWTPSTTGKDFAFTPTLKPLEPFRESIVVVTNFTRAATQGGDHAVSGRSGLDDRGSGEADRS